MPAAALWWRLAGTLAPPSLEGTDTKLRPPWTAELHHLLGTRIAEAVITDPAWPGLVAAVTASDWPPHDLLAAAAEHLHDIAATQTIRPDEYARLLTYRVELLTHHAATVDPDIPHPAEQAETPPANNNSTSTTHSIPDADLHEPPPDPYDYSYGFVEDDLAGLDLDDLPTVRPAAPARVDDIDIPALRARRDAAHQHAQQLADGHPHRWRRARRTRRRRRTGRAAPPPARTTPLPAGPGPSARPLGPRRRHRRTAPPITHPTQPPPSPRPPSAASTTPPPATSQHHTQVSEQTDRVDTAVRTARDRLDAPAPNSLRPPAAWLASSPNSTCTTGAPEALRADTETLNAARRRARDLDDQLARAEAAAARSLAQSPAHTYDLGADLDQLQAEVDFLQAASAASPAAMYTPPPAALDGLDDEHRRSSQRHHHQHSQRPTASPASRRRQNRHTGRPRRHRPPPQQAHRRVDRHRQRHRPRLRRHHRHRIDAYRDDLTAKRHTPPLGSLIVVDEAYALTPAQLRWLAHSVADTNTKLVLIATGDQQPAHTLLAVLTNDLPNTQYLGTPDPEHRQPRTAIDRAEHHLAATSAPSPDRNRAVQLMRQRNQVLAHLRDIATTARRLDVIAEQDRARGRDQDRGTGLEL